MSENAQMEKKDTSLSPTIASGEPETYHNNVSPHNTAEVDIVPQDFVKKPKLEVFPFCVFLIVGCVQLCGWNTMLNGMSPIFDKAFSQKDKTLTVTAAYSTTLALITIIFTSVNVVRQVTLYVGLILAGVISILFAVVAQSAGANSVSPLFHVLGGAGAVAAALVGSSAFGFASQFPIDYSGAMSAGLGLAGVVTFVFWMIGNHAIWDESASGTKNSIWLLCAFVAVLAVAAIILVKLLFSKDWVKNIFEKKNDVEKQQVAEEGTYEKEGLTGVLKRSGWIGAAYFLSFTITLALFPTFIPLGVWDVKRKPYVEAKIDTPNWINVERDVLVGVFQICDLIARYLPSALPILNVNAKIATCIIFGRLGFFAFFIMSCTIKNTFLSQLWFLIIEQMLMTLTNGWMATVCFARMFESVEGGEAKARVASFSLLCTFFGIAAGQWIGIGLKSAIISPVE